MVRAHVSSSLANPGGGFVVDSWTSCASVGSLALRHIDYVQLFVAHSQNCDQLTSFLCSRLDVPVCHAFFIHGTAAQLSLRNFRHLDTGRQSIESITVSSSSVFSSVSWCTLL